MKGRYDPAALPAGIMPWVARYSGKCVCGKKIKPGQACLFDKESRKLVCRSCSKLAVRGLLEQRPLTELEQVIVRVKQLYVLPKPLDNPDADEMLVLLERLRREFAEEYAARRLLIEVMRLKTDADNVCIAARYPDNCCKCGEKQLERTAVIWCKSSHRIWCLECNLAN